MKQKNTFGFAVALLLAGGVSAAPSFACPDPNGNCAEFESTSCLARQNVAPFDDWLQPGEQRTVIITMKNTGTSTWHHGSHRIGSINYDLTWGDARGDLPFGASVAPGEYGKFYIDLMAPPTAGAYPFRWQMVSVHETPKWFGDPVDLDGLQVPVSNDPRPAVPPAHYTVVVAAGQSNMAGAGALASELPDDAFDVDIVNTYWNKGVDKCKWSGITSNGDKFGADWPFARALAKLGKESLHDIGIDGPIAVIKYVRGGSNLYEDWEKGNTAGYQLYDGMIDFVNERLAELTSSGSTYEMGAFLWSQGEADVGSAEDYGANLIALLQNVEADLGLEYFLISRLSDFSPSLAAVRAGQVAAADTVDGAEWVDTDDLVLPDGIHFDAESQRAIGLRMAVAYLRSVWQLNP